MAHSYTPGLKVIPCMKVQKRRLLPIPGEVLVKVGDKVKAEQVVARTELPGKVHSINIANRMGCGASEVREFLKVKEGDVIARNGILAENKPWIPFFKTTVQSPVAGTIGAISAITGLMLIHEAPTVLNLLAYIDGTVTEVQPTFGVTVEHDSTFIQGIFGIGGEVNGEISVAVKGPDEELLPEHINETHRGKIIIGGNHIGLDSIEKAKSVGAKAVVAGGLHDRDLRHILGYDIGVAVTGTEQIGITIVITEGFGHIPMAEHTFNLIKSREGEKASLSGATQIRAGVMRPELIVPGAPCDGTYKVKSADEVGAIKVGDPVRIIREPNFGQLGTVTALPSELLKIATESHVRVMEVTLEHGEKLTIPRANVELVEK